jgi:hypothetical protein
MVKTPLVRVGFLFLFAILYMKAGRAQSVCVSAMGWTAGIRFPARGKIFLFSIASRPALGFIQPPIKVVPGALSPGLERSGLKVDHSPSASAEVKNVGALPPLPICLIIKRRNNFTFLPFIGL